MKLNNIYFEIKENAISNKYGKSKFYVPTPKNSSNLSSSSSLDINEIKRTYKNVSYETLEVSTIPFSNLLKETNPKKKYLVKIDIEGSEYKVISSTKLLKTSKNIDLIVEFNINNPSNKKLFNLLKDFGYESYLMTNKGLIKEFKPLTIPKPKIKASRTIWRNHFFTKKPERLINKINKEKIGYII
jgi:FkbM family methyltransferase